MKPFTVIVSIMLRVVIVFILAFVFRVDGEITLSYDEVLEELEKIKNMSIPDDRKLIIPGTFWCGMGDISFDNESLGYLKNVDGCCREHDRCPDVIYSGETKYELTNYAFYKKSSCSCDQKLFYCLKNNPDTPSAALGFFYFDILGTQCFRNDYPIIGCRNYANIIHRKCIDYIFDTNGMKSYQWFDEPIYYKRLD